MEPEGWDDDTLRANPARVLLVFCNLVLFAVFFAMLTRSSRPL